MTIKAGELDRRITIETGAQGRNAYGGEARV